MNIKTLIAASVLAVASTAATAQNVTTQSGEAVIIEKNVGLDNGLIIPIGLTVGFITFAMSKSNSGS